jgi:hypothetical protein
VNHQSKTQTLDEWHRPGRSPDRLDENFPFDAIVLTVSGNGTKHSVLELSPANPLTPAAPYKFNDLNEFRAFIAQLNLIASTWEERLGISKRG